MTVVDLDVARPRLHRRLGADGAPGAADVVAGRIRIDDGLITFDDRGVPVTDAPFAAGCVSLLPAGALDGSLWDMLSSPALRDVFRRLRRDSDLILVACPPASEPDAVAALADLADGLVVVARLGSLRWDDAAVAAVGDREHPDAEARCRRGRRRCRLLPSRRSHRPDARARDVVDPLTEPTASSAAIRLTSSAAGSTAVTSPDALAGVEAHRLEIAGRRRAEARPPRSARSRRRPTRDDLALARPRARPAGGPPRPSAR